MKKILLPFLLLGITIVFSGCENDPKPAWDYRGNSGPVFWGYLSDQYTKCREGENQSPIDITSASSNSSLGSITFNYASTLVSVINTGRTIKGNFESGNSISFRGKTYNLSQYHAHVSSEHAINGQHYPMELHFVHTATDGTYAVVSVLLQTGAGTTVSSALIDNAPTVEVLDETHNVNSDAHTTTTSVKVTTVNPADILSADRSFYYYSGSLTTPPCSENVNWLVMRTPSTVTSNQLAYFMQLINYNNRPSQLLNTRTVTSN